LSDALAWLERTIPSAPEDLREALANALERSPNEERPGVAEALARAACDLYAQVLTGTGGREDALVLLAADALFTHAFQARAEEDPLELADFAGRWGGRGVIGQLAEDTTEGSR
jgi:hypothetical protein